MKINKNSLQARIKNLSSQKGVPSNVILQDYFFDAFLKRLAKSQYVENFVFKGGFLLSTTLGIDFRSTMDMDFLLTKLAMSKENIEKIFKGIAEIDVDDNITFEFVNILKKIVCFGNKVNLFIVDLMFSDVFIFLSQILF